MNTKKIILNTLCVLAVTVAAQNLYAQGSPSVDAMMFGEMWKGSFTSSTKKTTNTSSAKATTDTKSGDTQATQHAATSGYANAGREMKIVNGAEYNARIAGEICECIGDACKCVWNGIKNFFTESFKNVPSGFIPGREGAMMRTGENFWKNIQSQPQAEPKKSTLNADSLDAALHRAAAAAALEHATQK